MALDCEYAIIGGGVAGLSMGIGLDNIQKDYIIFEQSTELKGIGAGFGLAANAMQAFEYLKLRQEVEQISFYTESFNILDHKGKILIEPDTKSLSSQYNQKNFTVHRADLHLFLLSNITSEKILLGKHIVSQEQEAHGIVLHCQDGSTYRCKYLIVADGVKSKIRQQLAPSATPRYSGYTCWRATIDNDSIGLKMGTETWGYKGRFGMTPLVNNRIYWYACVNSSPNNPRYRNFKCSDLSQHFSGYHEPIASILQKTKDEDLIWSDIVDIKPLKKFAYGNILLIGDAAHATTPNLGQGACQALEDVAVLIDEIGRKDDIQEAFLSFEKRRIDRTKYIVDTSRFIGQVAQWDNLLAILVRNTLLKLLPARLSQRNLEKLLSIDFMQTTP